jgi:hypothetical protein
MRNNVYGWLRKPWGAGRGGAERPEQCVCVPLAAECRHVKR